MSGTTTGANPQHRTARRATATAAWTLVVLAAGLEIVWALALTEAEGLRHPVWAIGGFAIAILSLTMLTIALRTLPLGSAYAVWVGLGSVGVALAGIIVLGEPLTFPRAACLVLIVVGVTGLTLIDGRTESRLREPAGGEPRRAEDQRDAGAAGCPG